MMFSIDTAHLSHNLSSSQPSTISSYVPCNRQRARSLRFPGSQSPGHQRFMHLPGIRVSAAESNYPPRLRSKSAPFRPPGHVSPASDVFFTRASSNHLPPLDEGKGGAYPVFLSTWSYNSICERSECDQAPQRHPSLARSVPGLSPTELLIAAPTNSFRTCGACRHTARDPGLLLVRPARPLGCLWATLGNGPHHISLIKHTLPFSGGPPSRQWSTGWTLTPRHLRSPLHMSASLSRVRLFPPENVLNQCWSAIACHR